MDQELISLLLLLLLSEHLYSALSLKISNVLHVLCQYVANIKHLRQRLKESKCSVQEDCSMQMDQRSSTGKCPSASSRQPVARSCDYLSSSSCSCWGKLFQRLRLCCFKSDGDEIWHECYASKRASNEGVGFRIRLSRRRSWCYFRQKSAAIWWVHMQRPPGAYAAASTSSWSIVLTNQTGQISRSLPVDTLGTAAECRHNV